MPRQLANAQHQRAQKEAQADRSAGASSWWLVKAQSDNVIVSAQRWSELCRTLAKRRR